VKKKYFQVFFILFILEIFPWANIVQAQEGGPCKADGGIVHFTSLDERINNFEDLKADALFGFGILKSEKTDPVNPVVVTQDEKHRGVDISIEIDSYPGTITYETYSEECISYDSVQKGMKTCPPFYHEGQYHYLTGKCTPHTETVYRHITGESLQVWLKPTTRTEEWLGWKTGKGGNPLRFLYPEKWSLGTWTPEGFTTEGDQGLWSNAQIAKFIAEHPGFNFLKADPRQNELPSQFLVLAKDPAEGDTGSGRVIPLFGDFDVWNGLGSITGPDLCLIEGKGPGGPGELGHCSKTINNVDDWMSGNPDIFAADITQLIVNLSHIPLDLPGEWYIGVKVSATRATYAGGKFETVPDVEKLYRSPSRGYTQEEHSFLSYIWMSTPCNGVEIDACTK
jgi:hypothetical protein